VKVLITGAGGFLGRATVAATLAAGHDVLALHRPASPPPASEATSGLTWIAGDLRQPGEWRALIADAEAVIHCAAAASGDLATQLAGTVLATENLLAALPAALRRFVHVSSFSVYDFDDPGFFGCCRKRRRSRSGPCAATLTPRPSCSRRNSSGATPPTMAFPSWSLARARSMVRGKPGTMGEDSPSGGSIWCLLRWRACG